ncbi:MAG: TIGR03905 family TSCPD domain-containing protein [Oscillospiraceae bacterium]|nr:TIGR03905 family TSCPD domain-containing protein [Oscillospiraceae bacterium]
MRYQYLTENTCSQMISFELEGNLVRNIEFFGGCPGNLAAISKILDGYTVEEIETKLLGNTCGRRPTSCTDQLAKAVRLAYDGKLS